MTKNIMLDTRNEHIVTDETSIKKKSNKEVGPFLPVASPSSQAGAGRLSWRCGLDGGREGGLWILLSLPDGSLMMAF